MPSRPLAYPLAALLFGLVAPDAAAGDSQDAPPRATTRRVTAVPVIDGRLDDEAWEGADPVSDFRQRDPQVGEPSTERTVVRIVYDQATLYIAAQLFDREPTLIRASELRRDNELSSDDTFAVLLDTFQDHRNAFLFRVNPRGTRYDAVVYNESNHPTADWDEQWTAAAQITAEGWTAELAIPFKILRFSGEPSQIWGLNLERIIKRKNESAYWAGWSRDFAFTSVSQAGHLSGLEGIKQADRLRIRPYIVGSAEQFEAVPSPQGTELNAKIGLDDVKMSVTSNLTADLAVNPDFAQTEVDEQRVNLTRFSLFFPEKRQFFIEGADSFKMGAPRVGYGSPPAELFYSRRIGLSSTGDPITILAGGKMTGKVGGFDLGIMDVQTGDFHSQAGETFSQAGENFAVARVRKELFERSSVGGIFTNRQDGGEYNRVWGADARFVFFKYLTLTGMAAGNSWTGSGNTEHLWQAGADWDDDFLETSLQYLAIDPGFDPGIGFIERNDRMVAGRVAVKPRPRTGIVRQYEFSPEATFHFDQGGLLLTRELGFGFETAFQTGDETDLSVSNSVETLTEPFRISPGVVLLPGRYEWNGARLSYRAFEGRPVSGEVTTEIGGFYDGTKQTLEVSGSVRPTQHFSIGPSYEFNNVDLQEGAFETHLFGLRANVSFTTNLLTAVYLQYNSAGELAALQLRLNYIFRTIDNFYVVYNENRYQGGRYADRANRSLVLKATYSIHR